MSHLFLNNLSCEKKIKSLEDKKIKTGIFVPENGGYEISNGLLGMKRDINLKLVYYLNEKKIRELFGISLEYFIWKNHFVFQIIQNKQIYLIPNIGFGSIYSEDNNKFINDLTIDGMKLEWKEERKYTNYVGVCLNVEISCAIHRLSVKIIKEDLINIGLISRSKENKVFNIWHEFQSSLNLCNISTSIFSGGDYSEYFNKNNEFKYGVNSIIDVEVDADNKTIHYFIDKKQCPFYISDISSSSFPLLFGFRSSCSPIIEILSIYKIISKTSYSYVNSSVKCEPMKWVSRSFSRLGYYGIGHMIGEKDPFALHPRHDFISSCFKKQ